MYEVTLKDIAQKAGCSVNTVSLALKDSPRISEGTRLRIQALAQEMNYVSNNMARALVLKKTGIIGLILRNISSLQLTTEARYIEQSLEKRGYMMNVMATHDDPEIEEKAISLMLSNKVDGLIVNTTLPHNLPRLEALSAQGMPIVLISGFLTPPRLDAIFPDSSKGTYIATRHLLSLGHKRVIYVANTRRHSTPAYTGMDALKLQGYQQALAEANVPFAPDMVLNFPPAHGAVEEESMMELLSLARTETAFFFSGDELAIPCLKQLCKEGLRIPQDIAIASIDNIPFCESSIVTLTSVGFDLPYISRQTVDLLLRRIQQKSDDISPQCIPVEPQFFIRDSCGYMMK